MAETQQQDVDDEDMSLMFTKDREDGKCIRLNFYVQHLQSDIHTWLVDAIKAHGGKVSNEGKQIVPKRGYILIDPASARGQELMEKYPTNPSSPRWIVSWTFITACLQAKKVLDAGAFADVKPLFLDPDNDAILNIYLTSAIRGNPRNDLATKIANHGGIIVDNKMDARVIICSPTSPRLQYLRKRYSDPTKMAIESSTWVTDCVEAGIVSFSHHKIGDMSFTDEDDDHLAAYLAENCPSNGGSSRSNPEIYQKLTENVKDYPWVAAHTRASWQERYDMKPEYMDGLMEKYLQSKVDQREETPTTELGNSSASGVPVNSDAVPVPIPEQTAVMNKGDGNIHEVQQTNKRARSQSPHDNSAHDPLGGQRLPQPPPHHPTSISATIDTLSTPEVENVSPKTDLVREASPLSLSITDTIPSVLGEGLASARLSSPPVAKRRRLSISQTKTPSPQLERSDETSKAHPVIHSNPGLPSAPRKNRNIGEILRAAVPQPPTSNVDEMDEVDEEGDLDFDFGPTMQAMVAEHRTLIRCADRSASVVSLRRSSPETETSHPRKLDTLDMRPILESVEQVDQELQAVDVVPKSLASHRLDSNAPPVEPHSIEATPTARKRNGMRRAVADNWINKPLHGLARHERTPESVTDLQHNKCAISQASMSQPSKLPLTQDPKTLQASGRASAYATPTPTPRSRGNKNSTSNPVGRPRRHRDRGSHLQIVPVFPERVPARTRSPGPLPIFADLDPTIARALRKMCRKFSFTPEEVRQKWDLNRGDLLATFLIIRKNREFLDRMDAYSGDD